MDTEVDVLRIHTRNVCCEAVNKVLIADGCPVERRGRTYQERKLSKRNCTSADESATAERRGHGESPLLLHEEVKYDTTMKEREVRCLPIINCNIRSVVCWSSPHAIIVREFLGYSDAFNLSTFPSIAGVFFASHSTPATSSAA